MEYLRGARGTCGVTSVSNVLTHASQGSVTVCSHMTDQRVIENKPL